MLSNRCTSVLLSESSSNTFRQAKPFPHLVIDEFLQPDIAYTIAKEFPVYNDKELDNFSNAIEEKTCKSLEQVW